MGRLQIQLLGPPRITWDDLVLDIRRRRTIALVIYLAMQPPDTAVQRSYLADLLWEDNDNNLARLRRTLHDLKAFDRNDWLRVERNTVMIHADVESFVDARQFNQLTKTINEATPVETLLRARNLYQGEFLHGFVLEDAPAFATWMLNLREGLASTYMRLLEQLARRSQSDGVVKDAIGYTQELIAHDPLREVSHRMLMRLYLQDKQRARAMQHYHEVVRLLREELSEIPQPATRQLYDELLRFEIRPEDTDPLIKQSQSANHMLPPTPETLLGREDDMYWLYTQLMTDVQLLALSGLPGVGKSALIAEAVNNQELLSLFSDGILWITLGPQPDIAAKLNTWCQVFDLKPAETIAETRARLQARLIGKHLLLVIDDVWDEADVLHFKFAQATTTIIITSRFQQVTKRLVGTSGMERHLQPLTLDQSLERIQQHMDAPLDTYSDELTDLVRMIYGIPLLLNQLGKLLQQEHNFGLLEAFFAQGNLLDSLLNSYPPTDLLSTPSSQGITSRDYFLANLRHADRTNLQVLVWALRAESDKMASFTTQDLQSWWQAYDVRQAIQQLSGYGILTIVEPGHFNIHPIWFALLQN